jgi:antibiotic biosynthesis monooxygenase (ABM) superfamily enzyme
MSAGVKVAETSRDPSVVTSVIRHTVRAGSESRYEAWFREVTAIAQTFPGHRAWILQQSATDVKRGSDGAITLSFQHRRTLH